MPNISLKKYRKVPYYSTILQALYRKTENLLIRVLGLKKFSFPQYKNVKTRFHLCFTSHLSKKLSHKSQNIPTLNFQHQSSTHLHLTLRMKSQTNSTSETKSYQKFSQTKKLTRTSFPISNSHNSVLVVTQNGVDDTKSGTIESVRQII